MRREIGEAAVGPAASIESSKRAVLHIICWLLVAGPVLFLSLLFLVFPSPTGQALGPLLILAIAATCLALIRLKLEPAAALLLVYGGTLAIAVHALTGGSGIQTPQLIALPLGIMLAGWLLGSRHAIAVTVLSAGFQLLIALSGHAGLLPAGEAIPPLLVWMPRAIVAVAVCLLTLYIARTYEERLAEVRRLGKALDDERIQLHDLAENVPALIFHGDRDMRCLFANRQFADFFHGGGVPLKGMHLRDILGEAMFDGVLPNIHRALAGERVRLEGERLSKAGETRHLEISLVPQHDAAGAVIGFYALKLDVTGRKRIEDELRQSETKFSRIFHSSPVPISITRMADGRIADVNEAWTRLFGWTRAQVAGRSSLELGLWPNPEDRKAWIAAVQRSARLENYETGLRDKDGRILLILLSAEMVELDGEPCLLVLSIDLTEQKKAEATLLENEKRLREAQRIGHFGSWELDIPSQRMRFSDELHKIYERGQHNFGGTWQDLLGMVHPDDLPAMKDTWRKAGKVEGENVLRHRILMADGRIKHLFVRFEVFRDSEGKPVHALGTAQDITEQVLAREEVQRLNDELEARVQARTTELTTANRELESFAYSISHDLRAPLRGIDGFSHLLAEEYADKLDATGRSYLERVRRAAQRMGELIDDILELSRVTRQDMRRVAVDLSRIAAEAIEERARIEPGRKVEVTIAPECIAYGDPQLLRVLMQNLLENAWKYSRRAEPARIAFGRESRDGETVFFVRDNGVGFDMKFAGKLFAPFQRLHKPDEFEGTGIGLATVARVAHRHGGRVWAETEPDKGAVFRFTLAK